MFRELSIDSQFDSDEDIKNDKKLNKSHAQTKISDFYNKEQKKTFWWKIVSFILLIYLYLTITVQGNFLFRHYVLKYFVIMLSFVFLLFTLKILTTLPWLLIIPVIIIIVDFALVKKRKHGINNMFYEVWGILIACCWIVNLMLIMMDIMNFFSNIFGVSVILFTCVFIAVGNNLAGILFDCITSRSL
jgi:hypothetical protein